MDTIHGAEALEMKRLLISTALAAILAVSASAQEAAIDSGEPCSVPRAHNQGVSWGAYQALPLRCVPMKDRVRKVYALADIPKGWICKTDIFYDKKGHAGFVCGPVIVIAKWELNRPCKEDDGPQMPIEWSRKFCRGAGTGLAHCDDWKIAIDIDAQTYCHITLYEHVQ
ncbi:MAG: hypothetical protein WCC90_05805 [Methylocella sp.]